MAEKVAGNRNIKIAQIIQAWKLNKYKYSVKFLHSLSCLIQAALQDVLSL